MDFQKKINNWKFALIIFLILISLTNLGSATIYTKINSYSYEEGILSNLEDSNYQLKYLVNNGKSYFATEEKGQFIFSPENEIYCWVDCNIYPKIKIYREDIFGKKFEKKDENIEKTKQRFMRYLAFYAPLYNEIGLESNASKLKEKLLSVTKEMPKSRLSEFVTKKELEVIKNNLSKIKSIEELR